MKYHNPLSTTLQNGQTHSNCLSVFGHFVRLVLKGLNFSFAFPTNPTNFNSKLEFGKNKVKTGRLWYKNIGKKALMIYDLVKQMKITIIQLSFS